MARLTRPLLLCGAVLLAAACTRMVGGTAVAGFGPAAKGVAGVNVDTILLDQSRMRAITGAGEHLTIIPTMDGNRPVDIDALADTTPQECRFVYAETATFGPDIEEFHKTTFQDPPDGATPPVKTADRPTSACTSRSSASPTSTVAVSASIAVT